MNIEHLRLAVKAAHQSLSHSQHCLKMIEALLCNACKGAQKVSAGVIAKELADCPRCNGSGFEP